MKASKIYYKKADENNAKKVLYNIAPISNIPSIMEHGLLSHDRAASIPHDDISMSCVQSKRDNKLVTQNYKLHHYANLFFNFKTPMLSSIRDKYDDICILLLSNSVLDLDDVVLTDSNAASTDVNFYTDPIQGLSNIDFETVFSSQSFKDNDKIKHIRAAEVLVPNSIPADKILGLYVFSQKAKEKVENLNLGLNVCLKNPPFLVKE